MQITKIVITGGPCGGKSTALSWIQNAFTRKGYTVLFVPETATEFITGGVAPWTCGTNLDYQKVQMTLQLEKERLFEQAARTMQADKVLIVCDRGAMDNRAYMNDGEFKALLEYMGTDEVRLRDGYDAIFHLVTAAKGAVEFYTTANNSARTESPEAAATLDDKLIAAWTGHQHLRVIDNTSDFENKMKRLIAEISAFLGEPEPLEIERKFLIEYPDIQWLTSLPNCRRVEISQVYIKAEREEEIRIRRRGEHGHYLYYEAVRRRMSGARRVEVERRLSEEEYEYLIKHADPASKPINKDRYCLTYDNQPFEIDIFKDLGGFWDDKAIMEIELNDESEEIRFPKEIKVIREVTEDESFRNSNLAKSV